MKKQESNTPKPDIFGSAISAYYHHKDATDILVHSPDFDDDVIPVHYLFRDYKEMPLLERTALDNCSGKVLDVGCGAGSHALYLQKHKKLDVTAIDISPGAIEIAAQRGLKKTRCIDFFDLKNEKFDTLLFLMNGTGIIGKLDKLDDFFTHCKELLTTNGKILIDSSDLRYLLDEDEDGGLWVEMNSNYYGEMQYSISYKNEVSPIFNWLYIDFKMLQLAASKNSFSCSLLKEGDHFDYLALLKPANRPE
ncbi:methyltransferase domain-containing protein [Antarcticibacterium arcticum]|uniref:Methyltransferase domain-containing protein n=1 Tax=Antarcticibacterium arcticum TaxID=2585771 RepID=A0A5B8YID0_9FLAO|nr:methyltransferase domain-containing protein [Antarcticibacterium arcticum]QED37682.1 methyltransferase domain-containing protein [Antarcticibacterium arcticum]